MKYKLSDKNPTEQFVVVKSTNEFWHCDKHDIIFGVDERILQITKLDGDGDVFSYYACPEVVKTFFGKEHYCKQRMYQGSLEYWKKKHDVTQIDSLADL